MTSRRVVLYPITTKPVVVPFDPATGFPWPETAQPVVVPTQPNAGPSVAFVPVVAVFDPADGFPWPHIDQPRSDAWPRYTWSASAVSRTIERPSVASWWQQPQEPVRETPHSLAALLAGGVFVGEPTDFAVPFDPADGFPWFQIEQPHGSAWPKAIPVYKAELVVVERPTLPWQQTEQPAPRDVANIAALLPAAAFVEVPLPRIPWLQTAEPVRGPPANIAALLPAAVFVAEPTDLVEPFDPADGFPWRDIDQPHGSDWPKAIPVYTADLQTIERPSVASWYVQTQEPVRQVPRSLAALLSDGAFVGDPGDFGEVFDPADGFPWPQPSEPTDALPRNHAALLPASVFGANPDDFPVPFDPANLTHPYQQNPVLPVSRHAALEATTGAVAPTLVGLLVLDVDWDNSTGAPTDLTGRHSHTVLGVVQSQTAVRCSADWAGHFFGGTSTADTVTYGLSTDWEFGGGAFAVKIKAAWQDVSARTCLISNFQLDAFTNQSWQVVWYPPSAGGPLLQGVASKTGKTTPASAIVNLLGTFTPVENQWYEIVWGRNSGDLWELMVDGVVIASTTQSNFDIFPPTNIPLNVGRRQATASERIPHRGWIDDVEIIKGENPYTGGYTPDGCDAENIWQTPEQNQPLRQIEDRILYQHSLFMPPLAEEIEGALVAGRHLRGRRKRRRYVLPNGMRIYATDEEIEAWLRRLEPESRASEAVSPQSRPARPPHAAPPAAWEQGDESGRLPQAAAGRPLGDLARRERLILEQMRERQRLLDEEEALALLLSTL